MNIPIEVIEELESTSFHGAISNPTNIFFVGCISKNTMKIVCSDSDEVFISKMSLKHIIDQRGNSEIIFKIPEIMSNPTKIVDNSSKRQNSFILVKMNGKAKGVVIEIT